MGKHELIELILCLLLLAFLLYKEVTRANRSHFVLRILFTIVAVAALLFISNPVYFNDDVFYSSNAILITKGADTDSVMAFKKLNKKETYPVISFNKKLADKYDAEFVADPDDVLTGRFNALDVFGFGVNPDEIKGQPIVFHPSLLPAGITDVYWDQKIPLGKKLFIQGTFHNTYRLPVKITLSGYGTGLDSVTVPAFGDHPFSLTGSPKQLGRTVYSITAFVKNDTIEKEPVPIETFQPSPTKVLLLSSSPDFENRFLQNWLAEKGYPVITRTTVSRNRTTKTFLNTDPVNIDRVNAELLGKVDIVIADANELASLSYNEALLLRSAISQNGKGLIVRVDTALSRNLWFANTFPVLPSDTNMQHETSLYLGGDTARLSLAAPASFYISLQKGVLPLVKDRQGRVFTGRAMYGSGNIIATTLLNTFSWALSGKGENYDNVWGRLLSDAAPATTGREAWQVLPFITRVNAPVSISLESDSSMHPTAQIKNTTVYLSDHPDLPFLFNGSFWPQEQGWQTGIQLNGALYHWYVYGDDDWQNVSASATKKNTERLAQAKPVRRTNDTKIIRAETKMKHSNRPKFILLFIFLLACGYLWFENKYYNS